MVVLTFCAAIVRLPLFEFKVTPPATARVTPPAPICSKSILAPTGKLTVELRGIVTVQRATLLKVTNLPLSDNANW
jgi:hypothetical protein